ncbi:MAG: methyltransferase domain-containing protein [Gammaproteobacteria bacterium]|nr:methyltransferase domain-containing protein [Gammaproteobacteria bacterium]
MTACNYTGIQPELIALYTKLAEQPDSDFGWATGRTNAQQLGYADEWLNRLPTRVWESAAAVGNPFQLANISLGQTVLDLGCGAGADSCIAALQAGDSGKVIGIDCTPAMLAKARNNAALVSADNIEFYQADIADLPIADHSIDVVISNGAINLAGDKAKVFQELFRVLKPGGRLQFADMIRISDDACEPVSGPASWANCIQGTLTADSLLGIMSAAGFIDATLVALTGYKTAQSTRGALFRALRP